ncbi:MAG: guanine deaminase [Planctomycetota bacterium]|nr:MAG: guanine deaminase [Planctomycetota bacterium]
MILHGHLLTDPFARPSPGWVRVADGRIAEVRITGESPPGDDEAIGGPGRLISPGFIDAHTHPPQFGAVGCDGLPLLDWLERVVYPAESWWGRGAAGPMMRAAVRSMLTEGTLGFAGFLTSHGRAAREAIAALERPGSPRAVVGRVAMDREAPDDLTAEDRWRAGQQPAPSVVAADSTSRRVKVSVNPRFAPACSEELLAECGWAARDRPGLIVQTHLAESPDELALVRRLFPDDEHYTAIYDRFGLLGPSTLLAHGVHLSDVEWRLIAQRGCVVVHCPTANVFLGAGLFDLDAARAHGVRLALGSDIAAGPDAAMPRVARAMIETAKTRRLTVAPGAHVPSPAEAWSLITRGAADALGWADAGRIEVGAAADLLVLRPPDSWFDEHLVGRLIYGWSPGLIEQRIVDGRPADPATI